LKTWLETLKECSKDLELIKKNNYVRPGCQNGVSIMSQKSARDNVETFSKFWIGFWTKSKDNMYIHVVKWPYLQYSRWSTLIILNGNIRYIIDFDLGEPTGADQGLRNGWKNVAALILSPKYSFFYVNLVRNQAGKAPNLRLTTKGTLIEYKFGCVDF
jgi:hypothetical protein